MALLKFWRQAPPGNWNFFQKESMLLITAENGDALVDQVCAHRKYRGYEPTDRATVKLEIQRQICARLSRGDCRSEGPDDPWVPQDGSKPRFTMSKVLAFSRAALEFIRSGMRLIPKPEAIARAEICRSCVFNREMTGCACGHYHKAISAAIPEDRKIDGLFVCWCCGCDLKSKVNLEESVIIESNKGQKIDYPHFCWQREILERTARQE